MKCNEFTALIPKFIENKMELEDYEGFVGHVRKCKDCKEELEIHYMITVGLDRIEDDTAKSYDINGELKSQLEEYELKADKIFKRKTYRSLVTMMAQTCGIITALIQIIELL